jgi:putative membrane protein insertion efficiency factor
MKEAGFAVKIIQGLISFYQRWISPLKKKSCRFHPTCSQYAKEAITAYGIWKGGIIAICRILRCHPFNPGGFDPVKLPDHNRVNLV